MNADTQITDVVIVGGGITGCFAAYFLSSRGVNVTIVERDGIGMHASRANPGGFNPMHGEGIPGPLHAFALESFELHLDHHRTIADMAGFEFNFRRPDRIHLAADDDEASRLEDLKHLYDVTDGFDASRLDESQLRDLEPRLSDSFIGGLLTRGNAAVDAFSYTKAVAVAAQAHGAEVVTDSVIGVDRLADRATAVLLTNGSIACDAVIVATGCWQDGPASWLGVATPVEPVKGEMLVIEAPQPSPVYEFSWRGGAVYGGLGDVAWLGGLEENAGFDESPSEAGRDLVLERAAAIMPAVRSQPIVQHLAGLRPSTVDHLPVMDFAPGWSNVVVATGGGRKGMLLGSGLGHAASDLVRGGHTVLSTTEFGAGRFALVN